MSEKTVNYVFSYLMMTTFRPNALSESGMTENCAITTTNADGSSLARDISLMTSNYDCSDSTKVKFRLFVGWCVCNYVITRHGENLKQQNFIIKVLKDYKLAQTTYFAMTAFGFDRNTSGTIVNYPNATQLKKISFC